MDIVPAELTDLDCFFDYIAAQLVENADDNTPLFQPVAKDSCFVSEQFKTKIRDGFNYNFGEYGWRKLWIVKDTKEKVLAHIDLRHYNDKYKSHRVLLGMGVAHCLRNQGIGKQLVEFVTQFCHESLGIDWLDLCVLSDNFPAKKLYVKCGFEIIAELEDCYRIDGKTVSETMMSIATKQ